jgi:2-haloacid dehalogenase
VTALRDLTRHLDTITFDCYGTLIDWKAGLTQSFRDLLGSVVDTDPMRVFDTYVEVEAAEEAQLYRPYREILASVAVTMGQEFDVAVTAAQAADFAQSLPGWRPFPDTNEVLSRLKRRFRLGVLSNVDRDLFVGTCLHFNVEFDVVITAEDVRSYKPALGHFQEYLSRHGRAERTLHVAQSLYHDGRPASDLGLAYAWINRYNHANDTDVEPLATFEDLRGLADALGV